MIKQRFFIDTKANDDAAYQEAINFACKISEQDDKITRVVILVQAKMNTGWFDRLFGDKIVKSLFKGHNFKNCRPLFKIETTKTYSDSARSSDIVITCGLDSDDVFKVDDFHSVKAIIAIPWSREGLQRWVQTWDPKELRGNQTTTKTNIDPSCIVKTALTYLTNTINMETGIDHHLDNELAKTILLALHKYEPLLDADIVSSYLIRDLGWYTEYAKEIENLIMTLNNGKRFQGGQKTGLLHYYEQWKDECNKSESE